MQAWVGVGGRDAWEAGPWAHQDLKGGARPRCAWNGVGLEVRWVGRQAGCKGGWVWMHEGVRWVCR